MRMAMRMICHGAIRRCISSDSANGKSCGACSVGTFSASTADSIWESAKLRIDIGNRPATPSSASRACNTDPIGSRSSITFGAPMRDRVRWLSPPDDEVTRKIASATAACSLRSGGSGGRPSRPLGIVPKACSNSRAWSGAPSRTSHCHIGISEVRRICPGRVGALPSTRKGSIGRNRNRAISPLREASGTSSSGRGAGGASASGLRTTLRNCSSTRVATATSWPRSIARSNSRISSACACGGSCPR